VAYWGLGFGNNSNKLTAAHYAMATLQQEQQPNCNVALLRMTTKTRKANGSSRTTNIFGGTRATTCTENAETNLIAECSRCESAKSCQQQFSIVNCVGDTEMAKRKGVPEQGVCIHISDMYSHTHTLGERELSEIPSLAKCNVRILDYGFIIIIRQRGVPAPLSHFFG